MILIFLLLWCAALCGMEVEDSNIVQPPNVTLLVPLLKDIALHRVCCYVAVGKISVDQAKILPTDILTKIKEAGTPTSLLNKTADQYVIQSLTPDHRYILLNTMDCSSLRLFWKLVRLDLSLQASSVVDDLKDRGVAPAWTLSPSGNLLALLSSQKLQIKDIAQNKVIVEKNRHGLLEMLGFIGEKGFLVKDGNDYIHCMLIKEKLDGYTTTFKYVGVLHGSEEFVVYNNGYFLMMSLEGKATKTIKASDFRDWNYTKSALYEPKMFIAYEQNNSSIGIQSLETAEVLSELQYGGDLAALSFAHMGSWLIVANKESLEDRITMWDWQHKQKLAVLQPREGIFHLSYTDQPTPYPCLFELGYVGLYSFDPIKAVAANILASTAVQKIITTSNDNNEKTAALTSMEIDK